VSLEEMLGAGVSRYRSARFESGRRERRGRGGRSQGGCTVTRGDKGVSTRLGGSYSRFQWGWQAVAEKKRREMNAKGEK